MLKIAFSFIFFDLFENKTGEESYDGEWNAGVRNGKGVQLYCHTRGGGKYEGDWKNDVVHGYGVRKYDHPMHVYKWLRHYSGSWKNGEWYGKGTIEYLDGKY